MTSLLPFSSRPGVPPGVIVPGSLDGFVESEKEVAEREAAETERLAEANRRLDATLASRFACQCCAIGNSFGRNDGLCPACAAIIRRLKIEAAEAEDVGGGRTRGRACEEYVTYDQH